MVEQTCQSRCLRKALLNSANRGRGSATRIRQQASSVPDIGDVQTRYFDSAKSMEASVDKLQTVVDSIKTQDEGGPCNGQGMCGVVVKF